MTPSKPTVLDCLKKRELAAVVFVRNYVQLLFYGPYSTPTFGQRSGCPDRIFDLNTSGYRDALCAQIGKSVVAVVEEPKIRLAIQFTDGVSIEISLRERDRTTPEAAMLQADSGKKWNVW